MKTSLVQISVRRSSGDPGGVLSKWSLRDLVQVLVRRSCGDPGDVLSVVLADRPQILIRRCCGVLVNLRRSLHDLARVLVRRSKDPAETLSASGEKTFWRSGGFFLYMSRVRRFCSNPP